ncbi:MAG: ion transporter [Carnobacterium sp.]|uniref:ion transporter n=1 Tax=unclassified Carnobacterium TaxID=257487 RepID=UPI001911F6DD|nr:ion transporter [Carnobacterium sp. CS13]QQP69965.1 ion transporter [Carnobacterium sp. CS13]
MKKKRIFEIIQIGRDTDILSRIFDFTIVTAILANLVLTIYSTFDSSIDYAGIIHTVEMATVILFTIEYGLRIWTANYLYPNTSKSRAIFKYAFSFTGLVDFLSFFPFYLPFFFPDGAVAFRIFRVVRILRLFRINQYYDSLNVITDVLKNKKQQLISSVFIIFVLMTAASLVMYNFEHAAQPDVFTNAFSGFWWAASSLLTVGYGDIYPITLAGKLFGIVITFLGVGMVAIPTGILSAGFVEQLTTVQEPNSIQYCPHCGKKLL